MAKSTGRWMIYGANGYTGRLTARLARERGLEPILAGRGKRAIEALAEELGFEKSILQLGDERALAMALEGVEVVLHCAGPFSATSAPMLEACLRAGAHYLDITGEIDVFEAVHARDAECKSASITAIPGVGFDVVPSDCLAAMLKREMPGATRLRLAFKPVGGGFSPGTMKTAVEGLAGGPRVRREGAIVRAEFKTELIAIVDEPETAALIPWGDVSTAYYSTGIGNIEVYMAAPPNRMAQLKPPRGLMRAALGWGPVKRLIKRAIGWRVRGPGEAARAGGEMRLWGEAADDSGARAAMRMRTPEGYTFTADSSVAAVVRMLEGNVSVGALTPSAAFGAEFVLGLEGVQCQEVDRSGS